MTRMRLAFFGCVLAFLSACTPTQITRGNLVEAEQIEKVKLGFHTRSDILRYMGSPTAKAPFDENKWYYVGQEAEKRGILDEEIVAEQVVVVEFNDKGVVQNVETLTPDRVAVPYERGKTKTHGNDYTFVEQLLGNIGRFNVPQ